MTQSFYSAHWNDTNGNPAGGTSSGIGFNISWQNGPLGRDNDRLKPNGAFVETLLAVVRDRLEYYQASKFNCQYNQDAINYIDKALEALNNRTKDRENRKVEGTHND